MKQSYLLFSLLFLLCECCFAQEIDTITDVELIKTMEKIDLEIESITDFSTLKEYWEKVDRLDQAKRACKSSLTNDLLNAYRIYLLIKKHGYPSIEDFGREINIIPYIVYVHQTNRFEAESPRKFLFPYFYKAWLEGKISHQEMKAVVCIPCEYNRKLHLGEGMLEKTEIYKVVKECEYNIEPNPNAPFKKMIRKVLKDKKHHEKTDSIFGEWSNERYEWIFFVRDGKKYLNRFGMGCSSIGANALRESKTAEGVRYDYEFYRYDYYFIIDKKGVLNVCNDRTGKKIKVKPKE